MSDISWNNETVNEWGGNGNDIFCPDDIWQIVSHVPGWRLQRASSEWPWHYNGSQNRDIYLQFVYIPISSYNVYPFELRVPFDHNDPRDRDDHQHPQDVTAFGDVLLWSERGDNSCGVIFVVFTPSDKFIELFHYGRGIKRAKEEQQSFQLAEGAVLQGR